TFFRDHLLLIALQIGRSPVSAHVFPALFHQTTPSALTFGFTVDFILKTCSTASSTVSGRVRFSVGTTSKSPHLSPSGSVSKPSTWKTRRCFPCTFRVRSQEHTSE